MSEENQTNPNETQTPPPAPVVSRADFERVSAELKKLSTDKAALEERIKAKDLEEAKKRQDWKSIAEQKEREAQQAIAESKNLRDSYINEKKFTSLKDEAQRLGLRQEAIDDLSMIGLDDVTIESTSTGKINILGAKAAAEKIKLMRPHWFSNPSLPSVNSDLPSVQNGSKISYQKLREAEVEAGKTGNYVDYKKLLMAYRAQNQ